MLPFVVLLQFGGQGPVYSTPIVPIEQTSNFLNSFLKKKSHNFYYCVEYFLN